MSYDEVDYRRLQDLEEKNLEEKNLGEKNLEEKNLEEKNLEEKNLEEKKSKIRRISKFGKRNFRQKEWKLVWIIYTGLFKFFAERFELNDDL